MTDEAWLRWKSLPETGIFFNFLRDVRAQEGENVAMLVAGGIRVNPESVDKATMTCEALLFVEEADFHLIESFYGDKEDE